MSPNKRTLALITGASSGLGAEYARQLAAQQVNLILVARRKDKLDRLASDLESEQGVEVEVFVADLSSREELARVAKRIRALGTVDLLVNNAGFGTYGMLADLDIDTQLAMNSVHMDATLVLSQAALQGMAKMGRGEIVNLSSTAAFLPFPGAANYVASKAYVNGLSETLQLEVAPLGVTIQCLCPGFTHTGFHDTDTWPLDMAWVPEEQWMDAADVVRESLETVGQGGVIHIPGEGNRQAVAKALENLYFL